MGQDLTRESRSVTIWCFQTHICPPDWITRVSMLWSKGRQNCTDSSVGRFGCWSGTVFREYLFRSHLIEHSASSTLTNIISHKPTGCCTEPRWWRAPFQWWTALQQLPDLKDVCPSAWRPALKSHPGALCSPDLPANQAAVAPPNRGLSEPRAAIQLGLLADQGTAFPTDLREVEFYLRGWKTQLDCGTGGLGVDTPGLTVHLTKSRMSSDAEALTLNGLQLFTIRFEVWTKIPLRDCTRHPTFKHSHVVWCVLGGVHVLLSCTV